MTESIASSTCVSVVPGVGAHLGALALGFGAALAALDVRVGARLFADLRRGGLGRGHLELRAHACTTQDRCGPATHALRGRLA